MAGRGRFETYNGIIYEFTNGEELKGGKYNFWYCRSNFDPTWRLASKKTLKEAKAGAKMASFRHRQQKEQDQKKKQQQQDQHKQDWQKQQSNNNRYTYSSQSTTSSKMLNVDISNDYKFLILAFHPDRFPEEYREVATEYMKRINGMRDLMRNGR